MEKIKNFIKSNKFKAAICSLIIALLMIAPFTVLFILSLMQFTFITKGFWVLLLVYLSCVILILCFINMLYFRILNNLEHIESPKKTYLKIFINELLGSTGIGIFVSIFLVVIDQISKIQAVQSLTLGEPYIFIKNLLNFNLAYNTGAAWSLCSEHTNILAIISLIACFVILYFFKDFDLKRKPLYSIAIVLILGGTAGNMIDRFFRVDGVVDFLEFGFIEFPIFNLADSFLVIGTILLMVSIVFNDFKKEKKIVGEQND